MAGRTTSVAFLGNDSDLNAVANRVAEKLKQTQLVAEDMNAKTAASSEAAAAKLGEAYTAGTSKAAAGLERLKVLGGSFGVPMLGSLDAVGKKLDETDAHGQKLAGTLAALGKVALVGGLAGFAAAAYESTKGAMALQAQMERLHTQAGASQAQVDALTKSVIGMAGSVGTAPNELAQGMYHVVSSLNATLPAVSRNATELQVLRVAAEGAKVGHADLVDVTNALDAAVVSGIKGVQNYQQAMGALNATVGAGDMTMQDLADALSTGILGPMKTYGMSIRDVGAALAVFGDNNMRGQEAATKLISAVRIMAAPSSEAAKYFHALGMSTTQLGDDIRSGGLVKALTDLKTHLENAGLTASQQGLVIARAFGGRQSTGVQVLLDQLDRVKAKYGEVGAGANTFASSVAATHKTLQFQVDQLKASVQALGDKFGMWLIPKLEATAQAINSVIGWMGRHKTAAEVLAGVIGGVLATAIAAFAYQKAVAFVKATQDMVGGLGKLASGAVSVAGTVAEKLGLISSTSAATATEVGASDTAIEASNTAAGASFAALGTEAAAGATETEGAVAALAAAVETADTSIETANAAAGASFMAMLGPIGAAAAAVGGLGYAISQIQNSPGLPSSSPSATFGRRGIGGQSLTSWAASHGGSSLPANVMSLLNGSTPLSTSLPGASSAQNAVASQMMSVFMAAGMSEAGAAAMVGNAMQESSLNPGARGGGLFQWSDPTRNAALWAWTRAHGLNAESAQGASLFAVHELQTKFPALWRMLVSGNASPNALALAISNQYEQPASWAANNAARERYAAQAFSGASGHVSPVLAALINGTSTRSKRVRSLLYANPLPGMTSVGRTDMGVDFSATPGSAVDAIGAGIVTAVIQNWYKGQPLIEERLTQGPNKGQYVYYAEQLRSAVRVGQRLLAGQQIGTVAGSGTGLELGFGASGGRTLAQATTGYVEGEQTPAGKAFLRFYRAIGSGIYTTGAGGGGQNFGAVVSGLIQQFIAQLTKAGDALATKLSNAMQDGTVRVLENLLGVSTGGRIQTGTRFTGHGRHRRAHPIFGATGTVLDHLIEGLGGGASIQQIDAALSGTVTKASAGSPQTAAFNSLIANLIAAGQKNLADRLVAEHKAAMATLAQELYAEQKIRDSELLNLQTTMLKDQTQAATNAAQGGLNILKAFQQAQLDKVAQQTTQIDDMTQIMRDAGSAMVQSIQDATTAMTDSLNAVATGINDQTQTQVDILGERGLYGLNLIAQQLKVVADETKTYWDQQIALAQRNLDETTIAAHASEAGAQIALDQTKYQQDLKVAQAQTAADLLTIRMTAAIAQAQAHADAVLLHEDASVVGPAQIAYDLSATLPKAQQDVYKAQLAAAQGKAGVAEGQANAWLAAVTNAANAQIAGAQGAYNQAVANAALAESQANQTLITVTNAANAAVASAQQTLATAQGNAAVAEAQASGAASVAGARAQTQFAGSGLTVNIYGIPADNAAAIGDTMDWFARSALQLPS